LVPLVGVIWDSSSFAYQVSLFKSIKRSWLNTDPLLKDGVYGLTQHFFFLLNSPNSLLEGQVLVGVVIVAQEVITLLCQLVDLPHITPFDLFLQHVVTCKLETKTFFLEVKHFGDQSDFIESNHLMFSLFWLWLIERLVNDLLNRKTLGLTVVFFSFDGLDFVISDRNVLGVINSCSIINRRILESVFIVLVLFVKFILFVWAFALCNILRLFFLILNC
jgi:hypothetical protein